jgi:uncharacterized membrane protein YeaQ/YmgE (transglycosylase-associated protein family)
MSPGPATALRSAFHELHHLGIVGAMLGGWFISPLLGIGTIDSNDFSIGGLAVSLLGAVILLAIVNFHAYYAQHPEVVKVLGGAALAIALGQAAMRMKR